MCSAAGSVLLLVSSPTGRSARYWSHPHMGWLVTPRNLGTFGQAMTSGLPYGCDNDCYQGLDAGAYRRMLATVAAAPRPPLFVTAPDVVGDANATQVLFQAWQPELAGLGLPIAFVLQDGQTVDAVPWTQIAAVFVGGSTLFKETAGTLIQAARARGTHVHAGRVNTLRRMRLMDAIGPVDSFDGSIFAKQPDKFIPWMLRGLDHQQHGLEGILL
jgi:hypothetical protein